VSGLNMVTENISALIDDEKGAIFFYDLKNNKVVSTVHFAPKGDWEDLVVGNDTAFALKSDGTLVEITSLKDNGKEVVKQTFRTGLSKDNDTEGLCYDRKNSRLLIACKNKPGLKNSSEKYKGKKAIYAFDLNTKRLLDTPVFLIDEAKVESHIFAMQKNLIRKFMKVFQIEAKNTFQPAGIAIHPLTDDIYVISASGNILVVLNQKGDILKSVKLPSSIFIQPEGITFDPSGNLFVSNEGKAGKGTVLKFLYNKSLLHE